MDLEQLLQLYYNVSREEMEKLYARELFFEDSSSDSDNDELEVVVARSVRRLHENREKEKRKGSVSYLAGPLVQVLYVHLLPVDHQPFAVHGRIYIEFRDAANGEKIIHNLYDRPAHDAQIIGPDGGTLALTSPICPRGVFDWPHNISMSLFDTSLVLNVFAGGKKLFNRDSCFSNDTSELEHYIRGRLDSSITYEVCYAPMPLAIYGYLRVEVHKKGEKAYRQTIDVQGKIVARYSNTDGTSSTWGACTLFDKQGGEFERVKIDPVIRKGMIKLSRCWVALPAYASLGIDFDLSEFGTQRKILTETAEFRVNYDSGGSMVFVVNDETAIKITVGWKSPRPQARSKREEEDNSDDELADDDDEDDGGNDDDDDQMNESFDAEMAHLESDKEESGDEEMDEVSHREACPSHLRSASWKLQPHEDRPFSCSAVQIFSVFIGRAKFRPLQIYGSVILSSHIGKSQLFSREAKEDAFKLDEHVKTIPVLDGCQAYDECASVKVKFDLKDTESSLHIKGYVNWDLRGAKHWVWREPDYGRRWFDRQLCSFIQGTNGFAAIYYTLFEEAVQANVEVLCMPKTGNGHAAVVCPRIYGTLVARYNNYDYRTRYNKEYYQIGLFERSREDPVEVGPRGLVALSRCRVAVPVKSSLVVEANFISDGNDGVPHQVLCSREFRIRARDDEAILEGDCYNFHVLVKWTEFSH